MDDNSLKLQIAFPQSSEDHRLQLVQINQSIFAIVYAPLESAGPIQLQCPDWSLILLSPIKSQTNIVISAINVICLNEIESSEGIINLHASNQLFRFAHLVKPLEKLYEIGEHGEFQFENEAGALLYYYKLFGEILNNVRVGSSDSVREAQKNVIMALCSLAEKINESADSLNLHAVLKLFGIDDGNQTNPDL